MTIKKFQEKKCGGGKENVIATFRPMSGLIIFDMS